MAQQQGLAFAISLGVWLCVGCTPATPPAADPAAPSTANGSIITAPASGGGGTGATAPASSGGSENGSVDSANVGGADTAHQKMCGGIAGIQCPERQYCAFA